MWLCALSLVLCDSARGGAGVRICVRHAVRFRLSPRCDGGDSGQPHAGCAAQATAVTMATIYGQAHVHIHVQHAGDVRRALAHKRKYTRTCTCTRSQAHKHALERMS
eukprot:8297659-Alexandrium_andersonii.AAC.1